MKYYLVFILAIFSSSSFGACGGTVRTSVGGTSPYWSLTGTWSPANVPNSATEDAVITAAGGAGYTWVWSGNQTAACVDVTSGLLAFWSAQLSVTGDYFRTAAGGQIYYNPGVLTGRLRMAGTSAQELTAFDTIPNLTITNNSSVTFTDNFKTLNAVVMSGATTTLFIDGDYEIVNNSAWTIPSGNTVYIRSGAKVTLAGNLTVNGTLILQSGATLQLANGRTLSVGAAGLIKLSGSSGNVVSVQTPGGGTFTFDVNGSINAEYFRVSRTGTNGIDARNANIQKMEFGEFYDIANTGAGLRINNATTLPSTMEGLSFYSTAGSAFSINATAYAGSPGDTFIDNWAGNFGGESFDQDSNAACAPEPSGCITWGTEATTELTISDVTASGNPAVTLNAPSTDELFATYAFALTKSDTSTDITEMVFTHVGSATNSEIGGIKVYDDNGDCIFNGADTQIGSDLTLSGSPATATISIPTSSISVSNTTPVCVHLVSSVTALGNYNNTLEFSVASTTDVSNSQGYDFSATSGPPITSGSSRIDTGFTSLWKGTGNWSTNGNWFAGVPSSTKSCEVGAGTGAALLNVDASCANAELVTGGEINFNNTTRVFNVYGSLEVQSGYTFTNAATGSFNIRGSLNQSIEFETEFPGNLTINNTGTTGNDFVDVTSDSSVAGNLTITNGHLRIGSGVTLQICGNITVATGAELEIAAGGKLELCNGRTLTVNTGGTLTLLGASGTDAFISGQTGTDAYNVVVNGNIEARYYKFSNLNTGGVRVNSGATIDATNHLQDGSFSNPINNTTTLLSLYQQIPGDSLTDMEFSLAGSAATGIVNIYTDSGAGGGTLAITGYTGDVSGPSFDDDNTYLISWSGSTNTIDVSQDATGPATASAGSNIIMGRFQFVQSLAGASYSDTDVTSLTLKMTGTGSNSDVDLVNIYYDDDCDSTSGTLIDSGNFTGSPGSVDLTFAASDFTVPADATTPDVRCIYIEYEVSAAASDGKTLGVQIKESSDFVDSETYGASVSSVFPITLGTPTEIIGASNTIWIGGTSTNWFTASNWSAGVPNANISCEIPNGTNDPIINGTAICQDVNITTGILTFQNGTSSRLNMFGSLANTGTINFNDGALVVSDDGATATDQRLESTTALRTVSFDKTAGGNVTLGGTTVDITRLSFPGSQNFRFEVTAGKTLQIDSNFNIPNGISFDVEGSSELQIQGGRTITVNGGIFQTSGINDIYADTAGQNEAGKAKITSQTTSRWSFVANSGKVSLLGFDIQYLDVDGLQIHGSANLTRLDSGQFSNLLADFSTPVSAITLNTSSTITETTASNVGFNWGSFNEPVNTGVPTAAQSYNLVKANNCGSQTLTFSNWFGDFWAGLGGSPVTEDKIIDSDDNVANTCNISIDKASSPVR